MKAKMLKIAGVKSEKEFYKKYPTEEAFMKVHGKAFKKAQIGAYIGGEQDAGFQPMNFQEIYDTVDYGVTGSTDQMRKEDAYRKAEVSATQQAAKNSGGGGGLGNIAKVLQSEELMNALGSAAGARKGKNIKKAQVGVNQGPQLGVTQQTLQQQQYNWGISNPAINIQSQAVSSPSINIEEKPGGDFFKQASKYAGPAGKLIEGFQQLKAEKEALKSAQQMQGVSDVVKKAASTRPEQTQRRYLRPENIKNTGEEFFPIYGVGTNVLAKDGASVGGGEIMNTFAPNTLYDNLGYEPLNESERVKQFYYGGKMRTAKTGLETFAESGGGNMASQLITGITGENAGGNIGGTIGKTAGMFFGPVGSMVGQAAGQLIGSALDRKPQQIKKAKAATQKNIQATALQSGIQGGLAQNTSFMQDGGTTSPYEWVSHTWQPQVIATFGEHKVSDLLRPPKDADMLRAGGHLREYTPPSAAAMSTERPNFQMGGELQTHWGGYAEPMSYNPYLPDGGETVMFKGQSHDESDGRGNTGIGITYGDNPVEVERGEPAIKMRDGSGGDSSLVVFGNLKVPKGMLKGADGKNFKRHVADLSKKEDKLNKMIGKAVTAIDELDVLTPYDQLAFNTLQAQVDGGNQQLMDIAQDKMDAAALQTAMNDTIEEFNLETTDRGTIKAKKGIMIGKAQDGTKKPSKMTALPEVPKGQKATAIGYGKITAEDIEEMKRNNPWYNWKGFNPKSKADVLKFQQSFNMLSKAIGSSAKIEEDKKLGEQTVSAKVDYGNETPVTTAKTDLPGVTVIGKRKKEKVDITPYKRSKLVDILNQALPYLRPSDVEDLDPNQLAGEMYALATNQLEPVQAQTIQPQLSVPYDISLQDILNENEASYRSQQRLVGYNPALQSQLNAQKYAANQKVLGEQFRMNQAMKNQIYKENRDILNEVQMKNLGILDQQYARQAEAKSKTKATTQAALNSIASKYAQNKLENRTLQTYENMYNYRFDPRFRAMNMNPLWQPNIGTVPGVAEVPVKDANGKVLYYRQEVLDDVVTASTPAPEEQAKLFPIKSRKEEIEIPTGKTGKKIDRKKALNSSIVKSMKNL
jgi:hypothetical protein